MPHLIPNMEAESAGPAVSCFCCSCGPRLSCCCCSPLSCAVEPGSRPLSSGDAKLTLTRSASSVWMTTGTGAALSMLARLARGSAPSLRMLGLSAASGLLRALALRCAAGERGDLGCLRLRCLGDTAGAGACPLGSAGAEWAAALPLCSA